MERRAPTLGTEVGACSVREQQHHRWTAPLHRRLMQWRVHCVANNMVGVRLTRQKHLGHDAAHIVLPTASPDSVVQRPLSTTLFINVPRIIFEKQFERASMATLHGFSHAVAAIGVTAQQRHA